MSISTGGGWQSVKNWEARSKATHSAVTGSIDYAVTTTKENFTDPAGLISGGFKAEFGDPQMNASAVGVGVIALGAAIIETGLDLLSGGASKAPKQVAKNAAKGFGETIVEGMGKEAVEISTEKTAKEIVTSRPKADFYVAPDGTAMPSTGYRYMDSKYADQTMESLQAPGAYFGFSRFESASNARSAYQISPDWSDGRLRGEFDTLQLGEDWYVPSSFGGKGSSLEPITNSYPQYGAGGFPQLKTDKKITFEQVDLIGE